MTAVMAASVLLAGVSTVLVLRGHASGAPADTAEETAAERSPAKAPGETRDPAAVDPALALASSAVVRSDLDDDVREFVRFCFTGPVRRAGPPAALALQGPDVDIAVRAETVVLVEDDPRCLLAGFPAGTAVRQYALALVGEGAAGDVDREAVPSTAPLGEALAEAEPGRTSGPDLVYVEALTTLDRLRFVFDEPLDEQAPIRPAAFSMTTADGRRSPASRVVDVQDLTVEVAFDSPAEQVGDAVRAASDDAAVNDRAGERSSAGAVPLSADGRTAVPDLVSARRLPGSQVQWEFVFDEAVDDAVADRFLLYADDASASRGTAVSRPDPRTVRIVVPGTDDVAESQVRAAALAGAVRGTGTGRPPSTLGTAEVGTADRARCRTSGPDLTGVQLDPAAGQVLVVFDEELDDEAPRRPTGVVLVTPSGQRAFGQRIVEVLGKRAVVQFDPTTAQAATRLIVEPETVDGEAGEPNPLGSLLLADTAMAGGCP